MAEPNPFIEVARRGSNEWWRYIAGIVLVSACWVGGEVLIALPVFPQEADATGADLLLFVALLLSFAPALGGVWLVVRFLHGRPFLSLITPRERIGWNRLAIGFGVWFAISAGASALEALLHPGRYQPNPQPLTVLPFLLVGTLLIPIQAGAEELFYRGYLLQGMGLLIRQTLLLAALNGLLFALSHAGNPETVASFAKVLLIYLLAGFFWALITLRSGTLELALGAHIANNLFTAVVANYEATAIPSRSFFMVNEIDATYQLVTLAVGMGLVYAFCKTG